jgi:hypothetical protein
MLRNRVLNMVTSLAIQELKQGEVTYQVAINNAIDEVCVRMDIPRKELIKKVRTSSGN